MCLRRCRGRGGGGGVFEHEEGVCLRRGRGL